VTTELNARERSIIELVHRLLAELSKNKKALDEATIDAQFLFRFDPTWCKWVSKIRRMMRQMMGKTGDEALSVEDGAHWLVHLESNPGLRVGLEIGANGPKHTVATARGGYVCFDKELDKALGKFPLDEAEFERLWLQMWMEANRTLKVQKELDRLALAYHLVPSKSEAGDWTSNEVRQQFQTVVNWVIWGDALPSFPPSWPAAILLESETGDGVKRSIRPWRYPRGGHWRENEDGSRIWIPDDREPPKRMMKEIRVRTWAIYYLTKRGGGRRTEEEAVELWNPKFNDNVEAHNFRSERGRLFARGAKKRLR
jgi:hypothetical protein